jgi:hypothetical protein
MNGEKILVGKPEENKSPERLVNWIILKWS